MGRADERMHVARSFSAASRFTATNNSSGVVHIDRFTRGNGSGIVTRKVAVVRDTAVVDKSLSTREIVATTVQTDQLDQNTIRLAPDKHGTRLLLHQGISTGQGGIPAA